MSFGATTIPLLPAVSFDESIAFWQALGFELVLRQKAPNAYAVVRYEDFELHLFGLIELVPENNCTTCLVIVDEVELLHALYLGRLQEHLGEPHIAACLGSRACAPGRHGSRSLMCRAIR